MIAMGLICWGKSNCHELDLVVKCSVLTFKKQHTGYNWISLAKFQHNVSHQITFSMSRNTWSLREVTVHKHHGSNDYLTACMYGLMPEQDCIGSTNPNINKSLYMASQWLLHCDAWPYPFHYWLVRIWPKLINHSASSWNVATWLEQLHKSFYTPHCIPDTCQ